jgi:putative Mg2+ transporter-C (MgtC) family protein
VLTLPPDSYQVILRLSAATLIGGCIGLDREARRKPAGMRTHALVSLGAAVVTLVVVRSSVAGDFTAVSRAVQGIIAGVGFLGGGVIIKAEHEMVHGLTTAASVWLVASLGIACGIGQWAPALVALALAMVILILGEPVDAFVHRIVRRREEPPPDDGTPR